MSDKIDEVDYIGARIINGDYEIVVKFKNGRGRAVAVKGEGKNDVVCALRILADSIIHDDLIK